MKKLNDLLSERTDLIGKMDAILKKATDENRKRTDAETQEWTSHDTRVKELTGEIEILERQAKLNQSIADNAPLDKEQRDAAKKFNLSRAIMIIANGGTLDGLEREMHDEGVKEVKNISGRVGNLYIPRMILQGSYKRTNEETKTTGASSGHIPTYVDDFSKGLVVAPPLYREIGCTVYEGLINGKIDLPFSQGNAAALVSEESAASQSVPTKTKGTLTAARFQGWQKYTQEYLAEMAVMPGLMADWIGAVDRAIGKQLLLDAVATTVISGCATSDTGAALTWALTLACMSGLETGDFLSEGFVMSKPIFYKLAATEKASNTAAFIIDFLKGRNQGLIAGIPTFGTGFLPIHDTTKYDVIYGDFAKTYVGLWGGVQLLVDPFSASDNGYIKITFSRLGAVDCNPYAVNSKRNVIV
jgi:HK97 family phage major capsid protein